jgi:soluble lytic murein transglycosylase-like protein
VSASAAISPAASGEVTTGAEAASERVQRLQSLIEEVRSGPASFEAALESAISGAGSATGASAQVATTPAGASPYPATLASYGSPAGSSSPVGSGSAGAYSSMIDEAATANGLEPAILAGLIKQESGFDPTATSSAGAVGLTQLMPGTASSLGVTEPLNPAQSIQGGARYLGQLARQFGGNITDALAAYNAGPGAVAQYGGVPPYAETQQYVAKVLENANEYRHSGASATAPAMKVATT